MIRNLVQRGARPLASTIHQFARKRYLEQFQMQKRLAALSKGPARAPALMVLRQMSQSFRPLAPLGWPSIDRTQLQGEEQEVAANLLQKPGAGAMSYWERLCSWLDLSPKVEVESEDPSMIAAPESEGGDRSDGADKKAEEEAVEENSAIAADPKAEAAAPQKDGIGGGKVTLTDFMGREPSPEELVQAEEAATVEDAKTLEQHAQGISLGMARSEEDMLLSIANGAYPRFIARVGPIENFERFQSFGRASTFVFATEPADLYGSQPAEAMFKVGWTEEWIRNSIGKEIAVCIFDTRKALPVQSTAPDGTTTTENKTVEQGKLEWPELTEAALKDPAFTDFVGTLGITEEELPELFAICAETPVKGEPRTEDEDKKIKCKKLRKAIERQYGANELYTGMGATMQEDGQLGAREVMIKPNGTGLKLTPDNHVNVSLGMLTEDSVNALFRRAT